MNHIARAAAGVFDASALVGRFDAIMVEVATQVSPGADVLGVPVVRPRVTETTALGAAYLAGLAVGYWKTPEEIDRQWQIERRFEPRSLRRWWRLTKSSRSSPNTFTCRCSPAPTRCSSAWDAAIRGPSTSSGSACCVRRCPA